MGRYGHNSSNPLLILQLYWLPITFWIGQGVGYHFQSLAWYRTGLVMKLPILRTLCLSHMFHKEGELQYLSYKDLSILSNLGTSFSIYVFIHWNDFSLNINHFSLLGLLEKWLRLNFVSRYLGLAEWKPIFIVFDYPIWFSYIIQFSWLNSPLQPWVITLFTVSFFHRQVKFTFQCIPILGL